jgi:hypothetical protein
MLEGHTHILVPCWVTEGDLVAKSLEGLRVVGPRHGRLGRVDGLLGRGGLLGRLGGGFGLGVEAANLQLVFPLVEDGLVMVLPELLGGVLACYTLEDLLATYWSLVDYVVESIARLPGWLARAGAKTTR